MSADDAFLPSCQDEEMVDNLLASAEAEGGNSSGVSLAKALLPLVDDSSPTMPWVCSTRYKTQLCTSYSGSGLCKYAERCQFAHGLHELHVPFHHPKYKTELCRSYHASGHCYYGSRCLFVHSPTEQRPTQQQHRRRRNVPCRTFQSLGVCPFGTRCNFLHVEGAEALQVSKCADLRDGKEKSAAVGGFKPKVWTPRGALCRTFSSFGFCIYGTRCRFQHGLPTKVKSFPVASLGSPGSLGSPTSLGDLGSPAGLGSPASLCSTGGLDSPGLPSPTSPLAVGSPSQASNSSSPPPPFSSTPSPSDTPSAEATANNAFTFSSQHLSDLLLPLALHLQQLEMSKAQVWAEHRAL